MIIFLLCPYRKRRICWRLEVPMPSISVQRKILAEVESEGAMVEVNRQLISVFEKKIYDRLAEIWGEEIVAEESVAARANGN